MPPGGQRNYRRVWQLKCCKCGSKLLGGGCHEIDCLVKSCSGEGFHPGTIPILRSLCLDLEVLRSFQVSCSFAVSCWNQLLSNVRASVRFQSLPPPGRLYIHIPCRGRNQSASCLWIVADLGSLQ